MVVTDYKLLSKTETYETILTTQREKQWSRSRRRGGGGGKGKAGRKVGGRQGLPFLKGECHPELGNHSLTNTKTGWGKNSTGAELEGAKCSF